MVRLVNADIKTREVLQWKGVHLLHAPGSSCSQKIRIFLNLKGIAWTSHVVNLATGDNLDQWYLGINPRGLVPCLVHDGTVHIESNDIIEYLEAAFPAPRLIPEESVNQVHDLLRMEDALHKDLRVLTFRYLLPKPPGQLKSESALERLRQHKGTVGGLPDDRKDAEIRFWDNANAHGITNEQVSASVSRFRRALDELDESLTRSLYALGDDLTVIDIAWYVYAVRLITAGYPLHQLHPAVGAWYEVLNARPEFSREVETPPALKVARDKLLQAQHEKGQSLQAVAGL